MVKIVILGSCRFEPYEVLCVPRKMTDTPHTTEAEYLEATKRFYPAIDEADLVVAYVPDGIGKHTLRDMKYAYSKRKKVVLVGRKNGVDKKWEKK